MGDRQCERECGRGRGGGRGRGRGGPAHNGNILEFNAPV